MQDFTAGGFANREPNALLRFVEAVVEVDAVTGETQTGGTTFETYVGKLVDRDFLLDAGIEAAGMFIPGVNLAKILVTRGLKLGAKA